MKTKGAIGQAASRLMRATVMTGLWAALCFIGACIEVDEHIYLNPDGSGKVVIKTQTDFPAGQMTDTMGMGGGIDASGFAFPPVSESAVKQLFPGDRFDITIAEPGDSEYSTAISAEIGFADVNDLMASPYGARKSLHIVKEGDVYRILAKSGVEALACLMTGGQEPGAIHPLLKNAAEKKADFRCTFSITLPDEPISHNGRSREKTVDWTISYSGAENQKQFRQQASLIMSAAFSTSGAGFSPKPPLRLALERFGDIIEQKIKGEAMPSETEIKAAAKFVPCRMIVKRSFDISGLAYGGLDNYASLAGVVQIAAGAAPQKWGEARVTEVYDDLDTNLLLPDDQHGFSYMSGMGEEPVLADGSRLHPVTFKFGLPDRAAEKIARLKGQVEMTYYSENQVFKIEKALSEADVAQKSGGFFGDALEKRIAHEGLAGLGIGITIQQAVFEQGMLIVVMETESESAVIKEIQAYDGTGRALPDIQPTPMLGGYSQLLIPAEPSFPISFAVTVSGGGSTVGLPVELTDISLDH